MRKKEKLLVNEQFLLFPQCFSFYHTGKLSSILPHLIFFSIGDSPKFVVCEPFQFETVQNFSLTNLVRICRTYEPSHSYEPLACEIPIYTEQK